MKTKTNFCSKILSQPVRYGLIWLMTGMFLTMNLKNINAQNKNVGIGTLNPDASAILDVSSIDKGLLIPRIGLQSVTDVVTIPSPATSLLVYNTNAAITGGNGVGFYYWNGAQWLQAIGPQGPAGVNGSTGPTGAIGPTGNNGTAGVTGATGPTGADGITGPTGAFANSQTVDSLIITYLTSDTIIANYISVDSLFAILASIDTLYSNYINVDSLVASYIFSDSIFANYASFDSLFVNGTSIQSIIDSMINAAGTIGPTGPTGADGAIGQTGPTGADGVTGQQGMQGPTGANGIDGTNGVTGPTGVQGIQGVSGPTGANGTTVISGTGTTVPLLVMNGGEMIYKTLPQKGIILMDANNQCWQLTVNISGNVTTQSIVCP